MGRLATDRKESVVIVECPNGCQSFELDVEGKEEPVDDLVETVRDAYPSCRTCGCDLAFVRQDTPSEVLE